MIRGSRTRKPTLVLHPKRDLDLLHVAISPSAQFALSCIHREQITLVHYEHWQFLRILFMAEGGSENQFSI